MFVDIKDAFLLVEQKKLVLVEQPSWWKPDDLQTGKKRYWTLARCLPGQRDAAARWYEFLTEHLVGLGFENHLSLPSLFRRSVRALAAMCHVDDLIIAGEQEALEWLLAEMKGGFTLSESGILPQDDQPEDEAVRCLKKRHYFTKEGIVIMPHERYIPALVELYGLEKRTGKATPESSQVELEGGPSDLLEGADQFRFRSALGTLLYVSQDRVDVQHCIRNLSQFMAQPTKQAEAEIKHVILYLRRTENYGLLLPYQKYRSKKSEILCQVQDADGPDYLEDSDWAGDKSSSSRRRHSVSSVQMFFPKALRRVLPENPLNTDTSTLTLRHSHLHTHTLEERKHPSAKYASVKVCKCKYASMICKGEYASMQSLCKHAMSRQV